MPHWAYVNGRLLPHEAAMVHIEDRGYQFADGVYEVTPVHGGVLIDVAAHFDRLGRSLAELRIAWPMAARVLALRQEDLVRRNRLEEGFVYLQITRGVARREHRFPTGVKSALVMTTQRHPPIDRATAEAGVAVISLPDIRWKRCHIKSVSLLANILGKQQAAEAGAYEAWMVDSAGHVTEGTSSNAWIVTAAGEIVTRPLGQDILAGITRQVALELARATGLAFRERPFTLAEAKAAAEAFLTSSGNGTLAITRIDGAVIGTGRMGPVVARLRELIDAHVARTIAAARARRAAPILAA